MKEKVKPIITNKTSMATIEKMDAHYRTGSMAEFSNAKLKYI
jgi:hypothetical protein